MPYGTKCDIFSLGSVLFNLVTGRYLFKGATKYEILQRNYECDLSSLRFYLEQSASPLLIDLTLKILSVNPNSRPTAREALFHPFFAQDSELIKGLLHINDSFTKFHPIISGKHL